MVTKYKGDKILGIREIVTILERNPEAKKIIEEKVKNLRLKIIDRYGRSLEIIGSEAAEKELKYWTEAYPPLRNTGWVPKRTKWLSSKPEWDKVDFGFYPFPYESWVIYEIDGKMYHVKNDAFFDVSKISLSSNGGVYGLAKEVVNPKIFAVIELMHEKCNVTKKGTTEYYHCTKGYIAVNPIENRAYVSGSDVVMNLPLETHNFVAYWLQPYRIVSEGINEDEIFLSSNLIYVEQPSWTVGFASVKPIHLIKRDNMLKIVLKGKSYLYFGRRVDYSLVSYLRFLIDEGVTVPKNFPKFLLSDPSLLIYSQELIDQDGSTYKYQLTISNVTQIDKIARLYILPNFYIVEAFEKTTSDTVKIKKSTSNSMEIPIPRFDVISIELKLKAKGLLHV